MGLLGICRKAVNKNILACLRDIYQFLSHKALVHSVVVSLLDVTEPLYIEILRSDGPQKILADVDWTHLKSY